LIIAGLTIEQVAGGDLPKGKPVKGQNPDMLFLLAVAAAGGMPQAMQAGGMAPVEATAGGITVRVGEVSLLHDKTGRAPVSAGLRQQGRDLAVGAIPAMEAPGTAAGRGLQSEVDYAFRRAGAGDPGASGREGAPPVSAGLRQQGRDLAVAAVPAPEGPGTAAGRDSPGVVREVNTGDTVPLTQLGDRVAAEVIRSIVGERRKASVAQLQLEPERLGKLLIRLTVDKGEVTAHFFTESSQAKEVIESSLKQLKEALLPHRLQLGEAAVFPGREGNHLKVPEGEYTFPVAANTEKPEPFADIHKANVSGYRLNGFNLNGFNKQGPLPELAASNMPAYRLSGEDIKGPAPGEVDYAFRRAGAGDPGASGREGAPPVSAGLRQQGRDLAVGAVPAPEGPGTAAGRGSPGVVREVNTGDTVPLTQLGDRVTAEVIRSIVGERRKASVVQLQLEPERLGKLLIRLTVDKGEVTAHFFTESSQAKEVIESSLKQLKEALLPHRLQLGEAAVFLGQGGSRWPGREQQQWSMGSRATFHGNQSPGSVLQGAVESDPFQAPDWSKVNYLI